LAFDEVVSDIKLVRFWATANASTDGGSSLHHQTTNLGVRSSNLFGRAIYLLHMSSIFRTA
jgi:hypothetical protein